MGTTASSYFSSMFATTSTLAEKAKLYGQRAFVGKVNRNVLEKHGYVESAELSIDETKELDQIYRKSQGLITLSIIRKQLLQYLGF